ncbi:MAG: ABC transporter ATP-binding protein [Verrucomicrobia bacterium]|nr:ABC transporter ATP-binding protein [Verrucomicrobiota bacterium]
MAKAGAGISISDLCFGYPGGSFELRIPRLSVTGGRRVAIMGPSGCGKTTLVNLISGISVPGAGRIDVGGDAVSLMSDSARRDFRISNIGFIFQEFELIDYLSVEENILLPYLVNDSIALTRTVREAARSLAESVGLSHLLARSVRKLSQGERQRVAVSRALITKPRLLIADEPTANLDAENARTIMELIGEMLEEQHATFLMITHEHGFLEGFDSVIDLPALSAGRRG